MMMMMMVTIEYVQRITACVENMNEKLGSVQTFVPSLIAKISATTALSIYRYDEDD